MRALQQIVYNPSSNIDFKNYVNLYKKKCNAKLYSFLVIDDTLASEFLYILDRIF